MAEREQVLLERGFVLHQRPYRDSSQLLECMTADSRPHGARRTRFAACRHAPARIVAAVRAAATVVGTARRARAD